MGGGLRIEDEATGSPEGERGLKRAPRKLSLSRWELAAVSECAVRRRRIGDRNSRNRVRKLCPHEESTSVEKARMGGH